MTSRIYHLNRFKEFTKVVFVVNICLVILFETVLLVADMCLFIHFSTPFWELNIFALILLCEPPHKGLMTVYSQR